MSASYGMKTPAQEPLWNAGSGGRGQGVGNEPEYVWAVDPAVARLAFAFAPFGGGPIDVETLHVGSEAREGQRLGWLDRQVWSIPSSTWKARTVGKGNASKAQVRAWVEQRSNIGSQDEADAYAIAAAGRAMVDARSWDATAQEAA